MSEQRKWRPIPPPPPPEVVLEERIGPHLVHVERFENESTLPIETSAGGVACARSKTTMYRAILICGYSRSMIGVSTHSADGALLQAARGLGYELDEKERP